MAMPVPVFPCDLCGSPANNGRVCADCETKLRKEKRHPVVCLGCRKKFHRFGATIGLTWLTEDDDRIPDNLVSLMRRSTKVVGPCVFVRHDCPKCKGELT